MGIELTRSKHIYKAAVMSRLCSVRKISWNTIIENMDWGQHISDISSKAFAETWLSHLGELRRLHTKLWYALYWSMQHLFGADIQQVEKVQRMAARWTCRRWRNTSSVGEMLNELQWPTLEARRDQSSLLFFHKIHCGIMSIDKDKYLTLSQKTRSTRSSHNSQYCRPQTYSDE